MTRPQPRSLRSRAARDALVSQYLPLVRHVVARIPVRVPPSIDRDDLCSVGAIGLLHAATTYDETRGASFKTFAYTAIRGAVLDEVRRHDPVPRSRRERLRRIDGCTTALRCRLGRAPTLEEIAEQLEIPAEELDSDLLALETCRVLSLDAPSEDPDGADLAQLVASTSEVDPAQQTSRRDLHARVVEAIAALPDGERRVVALYHFEGLYLKEIGEILGVSESRVSQILARATARLRLRLAAS